MLKVLQAAAAQPIFKLSEILSDKALKELQGKSKNENFPALDKMLSSYVPPEVFRAVFDNPRGHQILQVLLEKRARAYYHRNTEHFKMAHVAFEDFYSEVVAGQSDVDFITSLLHTYNPTAGKGFNLSDEGKAHLKEDITATKAVIAEMESRSKLTFKQQGDLSRQKARLRKMQEELFVARYNGRLAESKKTIDGVTQFMCPDCGNPLWTTAGGNGGIDDVIQSQRTVSRHPESLKSSQRVCSHRIPPPPGVDFNVIHDQEEYEEWVAARQENQAIDQERIEELREELTQEVYAELIENKKAKARAKKRKELGFGEELNEEQEQLLEEELDKVFNKELDEEQQRQFEVEVERRLKLNIPELLDVDKKKKIHKQCIRQAIDEDYPDYKTAKGKEKEELKREVYIRAREILRDTSVRIEKRYPKSLKQCPYLKKTTVEEEEFEDMFADFFDTLSLTGLEDDAFDIEEGEVEGEVEGEAEGETEEEAPKVKRTAWYEICGYPNFLATPSTKIRQRYKDADQRLTYTAGKGVTRATTRVIIPCACKRLEIVIAEGVSPNITRDKMIQLLEEKVATSMTEYAERVTQQYDPTEAADLLINNQDTLPCEVSEACQTKKHDPEVSIGRFRPDPSLLRKKGGGAIQDKSLSETVGGSMDSDDKEMTLEDTLSEQASDIIDVEIEDSVAKCIKRVREKYSQCPNRALRLNIWELWFRDHISGAKSGEEVLGMPLGHGGIMVALSEHLGKELHYSRCVHCKSKLYESTHFQEFLEEGGQVEEVIKDKNGNIIGLKTPGRGSYGPHGKDNVTGALGKRCPFVIDPKTQTRNKAHSISEKELKSVGIYGIKNASFDTWKNQQELLIRFAGGNWGTGRAPQMVHLAADEEMLPEQAEPAEEQTSPPSVSDADAWMFELADELKQQKEQENQPSTEELEELEEEPEVEIVDPLDVSRFEVPSELLSEDAEHRRTDWPLTAAEIEKLRLHNPRLFRRYFGLEFEYHGAHCGTEKAANSTCEEHGDKEVTRYINQPSSRLIMLVNNEIKDDPELNVLVRDTISGALWAKIPTEKTGSTARRNGRIFQSYPWE